MKRLALFALLLTASGGCCASAPAPNMGVPIDGWVHAVLPWRYGPYPGNGQGLVRLPRAGSQNSMPANGNQSQEDWTETAEARSDARSFAARY